MRLYDYAWNTVTSIAKKDYDEISLLLDDNLVQSTLTAGESGLVITLPSPRPLQEGYFTLQGLKFSGSQEAWRVLWRLFKASLYHAALHMAYSDFSVYSPWVKERDRRNSVYTISLLEDFRITCMSTRLWPGLTADLVYANCVGGLRAADPDTVSEAPLRLALKLLLSLWGLSSPRKESARPKEDDMVSEVARKTRDNLMNSVKVGRDLALTYTKHAFEDVYSFITSAGSLASIPALPHTEAHGPNHVFLNTLSGKKISRENVLGAYSAIGASDASWTEERDAVEASELTQGFLASLEKMKNIQARYLELISETHLRGVEYPRGNYAEFLRMRSALSGPIKTIRDQLLLVRNVPDETTGHESGQLDTQAAIQAVASRSKRNDVFVREEPVYKQEAWAILVDSSKSIAPKSLEVKQLITCLSEVTKTLIPARDLWGVYSFSDRFLIIKDFDEEYSVDARARIAGIEERSGTMLPDAIKVTAKALQAKPVDVRILVVASDGHATGYPGIEEELASTIKAVNKTGVYLVGVGVDAAELLDQFSVNCVAETPYQLMRTFIKAYLELSSTF